MTLSTGEAIENEILSKVVSLLESKHLYQSVVVDFSEASRAPLQKGNPPQPILTGSTFPVDPDARGRLIREYVTKPWRFEPEVHGWSGRFGGSHSSLSGKSAELPSLTLRPIRINCDHCDAILPAHNSGFKSLLFPISELTLKEQSEATGSDQIVQVFCFPFQCQACRGEPIVFMVRRIAMKLTVVGRSYFEKVQAPRFIPKQEAEYYSDAIIAFRAGRTLAALFYLRTLIEQYFRRVLAISEKLSGEDLGDRYATLLNDEFPRSSKTLKTVYQELSVKIHSAEKDEQQYQRSLGDIEKHFDLLRHFPLKEAPRKETRP
jgi:hypothetical protein